MGESEGRLVEVELSSIAAAAVACLQTDRHSPVPAVLRDFVAAPHVLAGVDAPLGPAGDGPGRGRREASQGEAHEKEREILSSLFFFSSRVSPSSLFCWLAFCFFEVLFFSFGGFPFPISPLRSLSLVFD